MFSPNPWHDHPINVPAQSWEIIRAAFQSAVEDAMIATCTALEVASGCDPKSLTPGPSFGPPMIGGWFDELTKHVADFKVTA